MTAYLGYLAGVVTVASFLPQVVRAFRTRRTADLSLSTFAMLLTGTSLWLFYGIVTSDWPVIVTNAGMVALSGALLTAKVRYK